jgi:HPt (histidine-containing phosphotransfer) domain-containing protein
MKSSAKNMGAIQLANHCTAIEESIVLNMNQAALMDLYQQAHQEMIDVQIFLKNTDCELIGM